MRNAILITKRILDIESCSIAAIKGDKLIKALTDFSERHAGEFLRRAFWILPGMQNYSTTECRNWPIRSAPHMPRTMRFTSTCSFTVSEQARFSACHAETLRNRVVSVWSRTSEMIDRSRVPLSKIDAHWHTNRPKSTHCGKRFACHPEYRDDLSSNDKQ